ncbi:MAG: hypothetical protein IKJ22_04795 [Paludibacteraceae bacterium]|nr:hypothetical protein [Paludibacteraceae bacterium]
MASRRALKKDINYLYSELLTECFKLSIISPKENHDKIEVLFNKIFLSSNDFIIRTGKPDGKDNPKLVKAYYKKLGQDLLNDVMGISKELEELYK